MAIEKTDEGRRQQDEVPSGVGTRRSGGADSGPPPSDMMSGLWVSWMNRYFGAARDWIDSDKPWWQVTPDDLVGNIMAGGVKQLNDILARDPLLRSVDQMWNANPLREIVPIDWAEITRALRTVWLHSLPKPQKAMASVAELNMNFWRSTMDAWNEASKRGGASPAPTHPRQQRRLRPTSGSRRRNGATTRSTAPSRSCTCWPRTGC